MLLRVVGRAVLRQRGQAGVWHCCREVATVTVIAEPWEHPCAGSRPGKLLQGSRCGHGLRGAGGAARPPPSLLPQNCLLPAFCFARLSQALGPAFYTPNDRWCQLKADPRLSLLGEQSLGGFSQPCSSLLPLLL